EAITSFLVTSVSPFTCSRNPSLRHRNNGAIHGLDDDAHFRVQRPTAPLAGEFPLTAFFARNGISACWCRRCLKITHHEKTD
ncbi:hypothetical protein, partial [Klebsiella pneumoniae]|uniref:hypothetical protein n=1 Tax=Klebsiella pneumoniae TaxID=573 RepID=UPI003B97D65F